MCPDIMSTGFGGAESGQLKIGDTVVVFAQGPIGLCATLGAKLKGATQIIAVDAVPERLEMSRQLGADLTINYREVDPVAEIMRLTGGRGVDVAIEALGIQQTFESCLRVLKPGGVLTRAVPGLAESIWDSQRAVVVIQTGCWVEEASHGWHDRIRWICASG
jgi:alcohol dehydrogenase